MNHNKTIEIKHTTQIRVRYAETDKMGVVYNGNYFQYFEVGRTELMRNNGVPYTEFEKEGLLLPVIETFANFLTPAHYDDILDIEAALKFEYTPRIRFEYNIFRSETTIAKGYTVHSFVRKDTMKPVKPPAFLYERIELYMKSMQ